MVHTVPAVFTLLLSALLNTPVAATRPKSKVTDNELASPKYIHGIMRGSTKPFTKPTNKCAPAGGTFSAIACPETGLYKASDTYTDCIIIRKHPDPAIKGVLTFCGLKRTEQAYMVQTGDGPKPFIGSDKRVGKILTAARSKFGSTTQAGRKSKPKLSSKQIDDIITALRIEDLARVPLTHAQATRLKTLADAARANKTMDSARHKKFSNKYEAELRRIKKEGDKGTGGDASLTSNPAGVGSASDAAGAVANPSADAEMDEDEFEALTAPMDMESWYNAMEKLEDHDWDN